MTLDELDKIAYAKKPVTVWRVERVTKPGDAYYAKHLVHHPRPALVSYEFIEGHDLGYMTLRVPGQDYYLHAHHGDYELTAEKALEAYSEYLERALFEAEAFYRSLHQERRDMTRFLGACREGLKASKKEQRDG